MVDFCHFSKGNRKKQRSSVWKAPWSLWKSSCRNRGPSGIYCDRVIPLSHLSNDSFSRGQGQPWDHFSQSSHLEISERDHSYVVVHYFLQNRQLHLVREKPRRRRPERPGLVYTPSTVGIVASCSLCASRCLCVPVPSYRAAFALGQLGGESFPDLFPGNRRGAWRLLPLAFALCRGPGGLGLSCPLARP